MDDAVAAAAASAAAIAEKRGIAVSNYDVDNDDVVRRHR
jgi:hypothetical protein